MKIIRGLNNAKCILVTCRTVYKIAKNDIKLLTEEY